jgi:glutaredoxin
MKKIYVFTLNNCSHCTELKRKLTESGIIFNDVEITKNRNLWDIVLKQTGHDILPTVFIQKEDDGSGVVYTPGRDFQSDEQIIDIIKKII